MQPSYCSSLCTSTRSAFRESLIYSILSHGYFCMLLKTTAYIQKLSLVAFELFIICIFLHSQTRHWPIGLPSLDSDVPQTRLERWCFQLPLTQLRDVTDFCSSSSWVMSLQVRDYSMIMGGIDYPFTSWERQLFVYFPDYWGRFPH